MTIQAWITLALLAAVAPGSAAADGLALARKDTMFRGVSRQSNGWTAGDVATSIPLSDGRVL